MIDGGLPPKLNTFLQTLCLVSRCHVYFGLTVEFPSDFDRNDNEVIAVIPSTGERRSYGSFKRATTQDINEFWENALFFIDRPVSGSVEKLTELMLALFKDELCARDFEFWLHREPVTRTLMICLDPGEKERWMEIFYAND